jgi:ribonuclease HI
MCRLNQVPNSGATNNFVAGTLSSSYDKWCEIDTNPQVLSWLKNGAKIPFTSEPEGFHLQNHKLGFAKGEFVDQELKNLLQAGAIEQCATPPKCISPVGCVPKKGGKLRLIIDLRKINSHILVPKFQYEDIRTVTQMIQKNDQMITLDITNGFHHIPIAEQDRDKLGIYFRGRYYRWKVAPFGLAISPLLFCKTVRPVIEYLRSQGLRIVAFVDDFILMSPPTLMNKHKQLLLQTLRDLGWIINHEKSALTPETTREYIGYKIVTKDQPMLQIPNSRIRKLKRSLDGMLQKTCASARLLARIAGQCISMTKAIVPGKLLLRNLYRLLAKKQSWEDILQIDHGTRQDLIWWKQAIHTWNGSPIVVGHIDVQVETDASESGWGAVLGNQNAAGFWNRRMSQKSSNYREMMAILMALKAFKNLQGKSVQILTDNVSAAAYINHLGGSSKELSQLASAIWTEAHERSITIQAKHLAGVDNVAADHLSRLSNKYEWKLNPRLFNYIDKLWGPHTIDRFASLANTQLPKFNSLYAEPLTAGIDALAQRDWAQHNNFVNPPFRMIQRVLDVVQSQKAWATIIAPVWPAQPWFQTLRKLSVCPPLTLPKQNAFLHHRGKPEPAKNKHWTICAWRVSGQTT